jgi:hypothetical protein
MRKYIDLVVFKYIELKLWLHKKKEGSTWDKFILGSILIAILIVVAKIIGFILK